MAKIHILNDHAYNVNYMHFDYISEQEDHLGDESECKLGVDKLSSRQRLHFTRLCNLILLPYTETAAC